MNLYLLMLHLGGGVALLLWAVHMVRTGVERSQELRLRRLLRESKAGRLRAAAIGAGIAVVLQSSTAVALLAAGFAASGALTISTGLALMLGADLGSALVVQVLSVDIYWIIPILLMAGGLLFFRGQGRQWRQGGRVMIGIALVLVSLQTIAEATGPLRSAELLPGIVAYLRGDLVTAFLIGAAFTWLVHSSVATMLLIATLAMHGVVPIELGLPLVLGVNVGGGLIAVGLTRHGAIEARRIVAGNLVFRCTGALLVLVAAALVDLPVQWLGPDAARQLVNLHLLFNAALALFGLPVIGLMAGWTGVIVRPPRLAAAEAEALPEAASCLDPTATDVPVLALASATRELLRMAELIERMLQPLMELYETGNPEKIRQARMLEAAVDQAQQQIKLYLARINYRGEEDARRGYELSNFAINLEYVGDAITKTLLKVAETRRDQKLSFSAEGRRELGELHDRVMSNMRLALNVLVSKDRISARQLLEQKEAMGHAERESYGHHLKRLQAGAAESIESSNMHLETVRALKSINSLLASVAYPVLRECGELLDSRLVGKA